MATIAEEKDGAINSVPDAKTESNSMPKTFIRHETKANNHGYRILKNCPDHQYSLLSGANDAQQNSPNNF